MSLAVFVTTVVHALVYACILLIILFRCIGVVQHPRFCFWFTALSKFVLECLIGGIESMPAYMSSQQLHILDSLMQATSTLIFLVIVSVFGRGYLPRNFIKVTFYLYQLNLVLISFAYLAYRLTLPYEDDSWQFALTGICINLMSVAEVFAVSRLANGWLDRLLQRISDTLCMVFFILACLVYLCKELLMLRENGYVIAGSSVGILSWYCLGSILLLSLALIAILLFYGIGDYHRMQRICRQENRMMLDYYNNVSDLYQGVRKLRHDLSNHLAAGGGRGAYHDAMKNVSDQILARASNQTAWQCIDTELLSSREKYEIYNYVRDVMEDHGLQEEALEVLSEQGREDVLFLVIHGRTCRKKLRLWRLRCHSMYGVIRTLASHHGGTAAWKKSGEDFALEIRLG